MGGVTVLLQRANKIYSEMFKKLNRQYKDGNHPVLLTYLPDDNNAAHFSILDDEDISIKQKVEFDLCQHRKKSSLYVFHGR